MISIGKKAPPFTAKDQDGKLVSLSGLRGRIVVLYFYPKDDTPGCTIEACGFRDAHVAIKKAGAAVLGVSVDDERSHRKFITKHTLSFTLLADTDKRIVNAYGVWGEKKFMGRTYMGTNRVTYIIDRKGVVRHVFPKVDPLRHAKEVLDVVKGLRT